MSDANIDFEKKIIQNGCLLSLTLYFISMNYRETFDYPFAVDDGSIPGVYFDNLTEKEVVKIYTYLMAHCKAAPDDATVWSLREEKDVPVNSFDNAAKELISGKIESISHGLANLCFEGRSVLDLFAYVFPDNLELLYRMGDLWTNTQIENFLYLIKKLNLMCDKAVIYFGEECGTRIPEKYQKELIKFINT